MGSARRCRACAGGAQNMPANHCPLEAMLQRELGGSGVEEEWAAAYAARACAGKARALVDWCWYERALTGSSRRKPTGRSAGVRRRAGVLMLVGAAAVSARGRAFLPASGRRATKPFTTMSRRTEQQRHSTMRGGVSALAGVEWRKCSCHI